MRRALYAVFSALLFVSLSPNLYPSVARLVSFDEKVSSADAIVVGRCIRTESAFDTTGRWIVTRSTFVVEKSLKGSAPQEVTVVTPGGRVGSLNQATIGVPRFGVGDSNVLFVRSTASGPTVLFFDQGAYRVESDMVKPVESDLVLIDPQTGVARAVADEPARSLDDFERAVRASMQQTPRRNFK